MSSIARRPRAVDGRSALGDAFSSSSSRSSMGAVSTAMVTAPEDVNFSALLTSAVST
jgi:hypothetical protein